RSTGAARFVHSVESARIRTVEATPGSNNWSDPRRRKAALETGDLPRSNDDAHDVSLTRHAGPLSGLPEIHTRSEFAYCLVHCDSLQHRSRGRNFDLRAFVGESWPAAKHDRRAGADPGNDSWMGIRELNPDPHNCCIHFASGSTGGMGSNPCAPK